MSMLPEDLQSLSTFWVRVDAYRGNISDRAFGGGDGYIYFCERNCKALGTSLTYAFFLIIICKRNESCRINFSPVVSLVINMHNI